MSFDTVPDEEIEEYFKLGRAYLRGEGVEKNYRTEALLYMRAVEEGHIYAACNLGTLYMSAEGVPQNNTIGLELMRYAAINGDEVAQKNINGIMSLLKS